MSDTSPPLIQPPNVAPPVPTGDPEAAGAAAASTAMAPATGAIASDVVQGAEESAGAIIHGGIEAVNEGGSTLSYLGDKLASGISAVTGLPKSPRVNLPRLPDEIGAPASYTGGLISGLAQFSTGIGLLGKIGKMAEMAGPLANAVKGGTVMAAFFDPQSHALDDLVKQYPSLSGPVTEFLKAKPGDDEGINRLKNALIGFGTGATVDSVVAGIKAIKAWNSGDTQGALDAAKEAGNAPEATPVAPEGETPAAPPEEPPNASEMEGGQPKATEQGATPMGPGGRGGPVLTSGLQLPPETLGPMLDRTFGNMKANLTDPFSPLPDEAAVINPNYSGMADDQVTLLKEVSAQLREHLAENPVSHEETLLNSRPFLQLYTNNPDGFLADLAATTGTLEQAPAQITALRTLITHNNNRAAEVWDNIQDGIVSQEDGVNELRRLIAPQLILSGYAAKAGTGAGRLLNAHQLIAGDVTPALGRSLELAGTYLTDVDALLNFSRQASIARKDPATMQMLAEPTWMGKAINFTTGWYKNALLGYPVLALKAGGDALKGGLLLPADQITMGIGKLMRGAYSSGSMDMAQGAHQFLGFWSMLTDFTSLHGRATKLNALESYLSGKGVLDHAPDNSGWEPNSQPIKVGDGSVWQALVQGDPASATVNALGNILGNPGRAIQGLHELTQQILYRTKLRSDAMREGWELGWDDAKVKAHSDAAMANGFNPDGSARVKDTDGTVLAQNQAALAYSRAGTYSSPLKGIMGDINQWRQDFPLSQLVVPFFKAPVNILNDVFDYTPPVQGLKMGYKAAMGTMDTAARDQAVSKLITGSVVWSAASSLAAMGLLTPRTSDDPGTAKAQEGAGLVPHALALSINGKTQYLALNRFEPLGSILAMAADFHDIVARGTLDKAGVERAANQMVLAMSKDVFNKSYLPALTSFIDMLSSPKNDTDMDRNWQHAIGHVVGGFVPSMLNKTGAADPYQRAIRGMLDESRARTPGLSQHLDPVRNPVTEEPMLRPPTVGSQMFTPYQTGQQSEDPLDKEVLNITRSDPKVKFNPPPYTMNGVDLRSFKAPNGKTAYDQFRELTQQLPGENRTLRDKLTALIGRPDYAAKPEGGTQDYQGGRSIKFQALIQEQRDHASAALMHLMPDVKAAVRTNEHNAINTQRQGAASGAIKPTGQ